MCGEADARWRLARAAREADLILVEGVMGLYDWRRRSGAELARRLGLPILLVQDAQAMAGSFGAIAWGLKHYRDGRAHHRRARQPRRQRLSRRALPRTACRADIAWMGALPRDAGHRAARAPPGPAAGRRDRRPVGAPRPRRRCAGADWRRRPCRRRSSSTMCRCRPVRRCSPANASPSARDAAFCFRYPANEECLRRLGARPRLLLAARRRRAARVRCRLAARRLSGTARPSHCRQPRHGADRCAHTSTPASRCSPSAAA